MNFLLDILFYLVLKFKKIKMALNPTYGIFFLNLLKVASSHTYQNLTL